MKELGVTELRVHDDDRGSLYEVLHNYDITSFGQIYVVNTRKSGTIRAFHRHKELWDWFCVVRGSAKIIVFSDKGEKSEFILDGKRPKVLTVPPTYWHGWMALEDDTILLSTASRVYNKENPDEERVSPYSFGVDWSIKMK